jgi:hypothetical protein
VVKYNSSFTHSLNLLGRVELFELKHDSLVHSERALSIVGKGKASINLAKTGILQGKSSLIDLEVVAVESVNDVGSYECYNQHRI